MIIQLEQLKSHLEIDTNDDDELLKIYISGIGELFKEKLGRAIEKETVTEYFDGNDIKDVIYLSNYPVIALTSFQYRSGTYSSPVWTAFSANSYQVDQDKGMIYPDYIFQGIRNIKIVYDAGYAAADIPKSLQIAALKLVSKIYNKKRSDGFSTEEVAGGRIEWDKFMSSDIEELISPFRKIKI